MRFLASIISTTIVQTVGFSLNIVVPHQQIMKFVNPFNKYAQVMKKSRNGSGQTMAFA